MSTSSSLKQEKSGSDVSIAFDSDASPGTAESMQVSPWKDISRWRNLYEASLEDEGATYRRAIREAAHSLDNLSDAEIRKRLLAPVEDLADEERWRKIVTMAKSVPYLKDQPWPEVNDDFFAIQLLLGVNIAQIRATLEPGTSRLAQQSTIVQVEKELPQIRSHRIRLVDNVLTKILGMKPISRSALLQEIYEIAKGPQEI